MASSVKVAVRVRPFNEREHKLNSACVIRMEENKTILYNKKESDGRNTKEFTFDYSYWSHDESSLHFASQEKVYDDLGSSVISNAHQGYNACVFAYGQTGSGKTFTMMGSQNNPGLIPRICKELFSSMEKGRESGTTYKVEVSYLEIYNERVRDLLRDKPNHSKDEALKVRVHSKHGPYVENLSRHVVTQYSEVEELMNKGNTIRATACTNMNDTSSRSHAIFTVTFIQAKLQADMPLETRSKINLVDLAGSERASATGTSGIHLQEGSNINQSLTTLGRVIKSLAEQGETRNKTVHIPYRNSKLTHLLKDSLGGNSKTIMIASIAKNIINKPTVNEDANVKLIKALREEIAKLKNMIGEGNISFDSGGKAEEGSIRAALNIKEAQEKELTDKWNEKWKQTQCILQEQRTLELRKAGESGRGVVLDSERPHLVLYDDDLGSTGLTLYHLNDESTTIGSSQEQDIQLEGQGMMNEHCVIKLQGEKATLERKVDAEVIVNDELVTDSTKLIHGAMIRVGGCHVFRYNDPQEAARIRKQGNRSSMNLSRLSFLSRSINDLLRSYDSLPAAATEGKNFQTLKKERLVTIWKISSFNMMRIIRLDDICGSLQSNTNQTAGFCEISTQTSTGAQSDPNTPQKSDLPLVPLRKQNSLTLPLSDKAEGTDGSSDSTPASDTFYTATSVLTPDVSELLSPTSPVSSDDNKPIEEEHIKNIKYKMPFNLLGEMDCITDINSPIKSVVGLLNSPGASCGAATSTPKRDILENGHTEDSKDQEKKTNKHISSTLFVGAGEMSNRSDLIYVSDDVKKVDEVLDKLISNDQNDNSIIEKKKELKNLQNHYTALESEILDELVKEKVETNSLEEKGEESNIPNRPNNLPLGDILKEERVVMLIEREVQRRLLSGMTCLEKQCKGEEHGTGCSCQCEKRMISSSSPNSLVSLPRALSPSDMRPFSAMSADYVHDYGAARGVMYCRSSDDLLLSPVPLHSPFEGEYDMTCGICVSLPSYELRGNGPNAYWEYHVRITIGRDTWFIFRRFRRFRELHIYMCHKYGSVIQDLRFPPRRIFGNHSLTVVEGRRKDLEIYLQQLITLCSDMEGSPLCDVPPSRDVLEKFSPFFSQGVTDLNRRYSTS
ncbi:Kinesin-like protein Klp98A [Armadillidium nasatum]|uniref:Kinesin-like protein Klp98A n=1 Tax=Armadillidium nasatum TaxID=96803 RepID=A0A5N5TDF4_9CRUS|nr:Kinesin-like protein Klp98A [Armadillidium nasatum]